MPVYKEGDKVVLLANKEEGWPEQRATMLGTSGNGVYCVRVDPEYREDEHDDGLREVEAGGFRLLGRHP